MEINDHWFLSYVKITNGMPKSELNDLNVLNLKRKKEINTFSCTKINTLERFVIAKVQKCGLKT